MSRIPSSARALVALACAFLALPAPAQQPAQQPAADPKVSMSKIDIVGTASGDAATHGTSLATSPNRTVGPQQDGSIVASTNQTLTPAGRVIELGTPVRAKSLALNPSPASHTAAILLMGADQPVLIVDTLSGAILQRFSPVAPSKEKVPGSFTGIAYSPDGSRLLFSQDDNHVVLAQVSPQTGLLSNPRQIPLPPPPADGRAYYDAKSVNPGGLAFSADSSRAYVALNVANTLGVLDLASARLIAQIPVGNAPNSVLLRGHFAYVTNEGGRPSTPSDVTNLSDGTPIVSDPNQAFATTGTVSVVDLTTQKELKTIPVGLHPAGMAISGSTLHVANAYSDSLSVIDLATNSVTRTISLSVPIAGGIFGSGPNAVTVTPDGKAYVTLGQANAIAVVNLLGREANPVLGYIPTAYFPTSIAWDKSARQLVIADDKGLGSRGTSTTVKGVTGFNTHADTGVLNLIPLPNSAQLARWSKQVFANNHWDLTTNIAVGPDYIDPHATPVAIPRHIGEPSLIKHIFLIIKENRTYDQMLGDVAWANGAPELAVFASAVPNQHAIVRRFPILDNVYAPSRQSADGHPWIGMSGSFYSNDILSPDWIRSYPGGDADDALTYTPKGFLWTAAQAAGLTAKLYGEWSSGVTVAHKPDGSPYTWTDFYQTTLCNEGKAPASSCTGPLVPNDVVSVTSSIPSAARIMDPHYPPFNLDIPDQFRADYFIRDFQRLLATNQVPNLTILWLPNDHTAGTSKGLPLPINFQADNDLALGRIIEAISNSSLWAQSAIFVEEDDSQGGADHVDGHRQPVYIVSPYTVAPQAPGQGKAIHTTYTAENINRTIENILGMMPLTQFDLVASPIFDAFQNTPDLTPFTHQDAVIPLNQGPGLAQDVALLTPIQKAWLRATASVMKGKYDKADSVDPNFLNHITWYSTTGWTRPYPGELRVLMPAPFLKAAKKYSADDDDD